MMKRKLIEVALPLEAINEASSREKSIRHGHPSTLHIWWARRPLAACRAVLWASLVDDPSAKPEMFPTPELQDKERARLFEILERLVKWENSNNEQVLGEARAEIRKCFKGEIPPIVDPFAGGGSIPLEAKRLGLETYASDLNPVAVLINRVMLEFPDQFKDLPPIHPSLQGSNLGDLQEWRGLKGLAADLEAYGKEIRDEAEKRIGNLYPEAKSASGQNLTPVAWIWARTVKSPDPSWSGHVPLTTTWVVRAERNQKPSIWIKPKIDREQQRISYEICKGGKPTEERTIKNGQGTCLATGTVIEKEYIATEAQAGRMKSHLIAIACLGDNGKIYLPPNSKHTEAADIMIPDRAPVGKIEQGMSERVVRYGFDNFAELFTPRQLTTLITFSDLIAGLKPRLIQDAKVSQHSEPSSYANAMVTLLTMAVSKSTDYWSHLCIWEKSAGTVAHVFGRQAIGMTWDYVEVNPFSSSTGNWMAMISWIKKVIEKLPVDHPAHVNQVDARVQVKELKNVCISTDPPYYDNIGYSDISDFFYIWLRPNLSDIFPVEFSTLLTPKSEELIADAKRHGSKNNANEHFESGMAEFMKAVKQAQNSEIPATLFYAYKAQEKDGDKIGSTGWATFLQSIVDAGIAITATWPMRTERSARPNANQANALASSVVLACRPRHGGAALASRSEFIAHLRSELSEAVRIMQQGNIAPVDLPQSTIGPGIGIFSNYAKVVEADGSKMLVSEALTLINEVLGEIIDGEEAELDSETRFAITWYEQHGFEPGSAGDADNVARAKNTSLSGIVESGIASARGGKFQLLRREELDADWSPTTDTRLTIWEALQHMVLALENSEQKAAEILRELGGKSESVFQLIYLLYQKADQKGMADEANRYNSLAAAWPNLMTLSKETVTQPEML